jgi:HEAT repeat protein
MSRQNFWHLTPQQSIEAECARRGKAAVVADCIRLIGGWEGTVPLIQALGGPNAPRMREVTPRADQRYWLRVWGARGLLWAWDDSATDAIRVALDDPHWRVREMAAKVIARHKVGDLLEPVAELRDDPVPRVRAAAARAVAVLTGAGA